MSLDENLYISTTVSIRNSSHNNFFSNSSAQLTNNHDPNRDPTPTTLPHVTNASRRKEKINTRTQAVSSTSAPTQVRHHEPVGLVKVDETTEQILRQEQRFHQVANLTAAEYAILDQNTRILQNVGPVFLGIGCSFGAIFWG